MLQHEHKFSPQRGHCICSLFVDFPSLLREQNTYMIAHNPPTAIPRPPDLTVFILEFHALSSYTGMPGGCTCAQIEPKLARRDINANRSILSDLVANTG